MSVIYVPRGSTITIPSRPLPHRRRSSSVPRLPTAAPYVTTRPLSPIHAPYYTPQHSPTASPHRVLSDAQIATEPYPFPPYTAPPPLSPSYRATSPAYMPASPLHSGYASPWHGTTSPVHSPLHSPRAHTPSFGYTPSHGTHSPRPSVIYIDRRTRREEDDYHHHKPRQPQVIYVDSGRGRSRSRSRSRSREPSIIYLGGQQQHHHHHRDERHGNHYHFGPGHHYDTHREHHRQPNVIYLDRYGQQIHQATNQAFQQPRIEYRGSDDTYIPPPSKRVQDWVQSQQGRADVGGGARAWAD